MSLIGGRVFSLPQNVLASSLRDPNTVESHLERLAAPSLQVMPGRLRSLVAAVGAAERML